ncbi:hypothetical protein [Myxococcus qinghaiensis]|uniref:hypothetical protein n=1 Tax=Myxococcus qinghaiensis TaxID=2906758 RepID=UPI0020A7B153|nr:hypothetical protein [Myxococcus qinghaiensis]MCP3169564.1 hypothetical protein [Myxococcus qinghaiensis]
MAITGSTSASIRYEITDNNGQLSGIAFDLEPSRNQFIKTGTLTGTRTGTSAQWTSGGDTVSGTLSGNTFTGTLVVAAEGPDASLTAQVALERTACVAESDAAFCTRVNANCGQKADADNCGVRRVVDNCGTCTSGTCTLNQCQPAACSGTTSTTCNGESGCRWNSNCCGGLCLNLSQSCPITCPPKEG